jgi:hypothetical protein
LNLGKIGVGKDHRGIFSAEFKDHGCQRCRSGFHDRFADAGGSDKGEFVDERDKGGAGVGVSGAELNEGFGETRGFEGLLKECAEEREGKGGVLKNGNWNVSLILVENKLENPPRRP